MDTTSTATTGPWADPDIGGSEVHAVVDSGGAVLASGSAIARAWPGHPCPAAESLLDATDPTAALVGRAAVAPAGSVGGV